MVKRYKQINITEFIILKILNELNILYINNNVRLLKFFNWNFIIFINYPHRKINLLDAFLIIIKFA